MEFHRAKAINANPKLWLLFDDGLSVEVDLKNLQERVFFQHGNSIDFFKSVYIDERAETVAWGEDLDLDLYALRDQIISDKNIVEKKGKNSDIEQ